MEDKPRVVFEHLFGDSDSTDRAARLTRIREKRSILDDLNQTVAKLNNLMSDIEAGRGTLGRIAKDQEYAAKVDRITTNLETLSNRLAAGEGSVGLLLKDPSLYNNADQMLVESRNLVKALRENPKKYLTIRFKVF